MDINDKSKSDGKENTTKYGETIPTTFSWLSLSEQKRRAQELNKMTKPKKD